MEESRLSLEEQIRLYTDVVLSESLKAAERGKESTAGRKLVNLEDDAASARKRGNMRRRSAFIPDVGSLYKLRSRDRPVLRYLG